MAQIPLRSIFGVLAALLLALHARAAGLEFCGETKNERLSIYSSEGNSVILRRGSESRPATPATVWSVQGDFAANHLLALWSPSYSISAESDEAIEPDEDKAFCARVNLRTTPNGTGVKITPPREELGAWPAASAKAGVVVFAWIANGQITQIEPRAWQANDQSTKQGVEAVFKLSPSEAQGQPVVFFVQDGALVAPQFAFGDAAQQEAGIAACLDDLDTLTQLEKKGVSLDTTAYQKSGLLHFAAEAGAVHVVDYLLNRKKDAWKAMTVDGRTPIECAVRNGRADVLARFLTAAPFKQWPENLRIRVPIEAAQKGHIAALKVLIDAKADIQTEDNAHVNPMVAAIDSGYVKVADLLFRTKGQLGTPDEAARVVISKAEQGATQMVRWLIAHKVDADFVEQGRTALMAGARLGTRELANILLDAGAAVDRVDQNGASSLMRAVSFGNAAYADALLARKANPSLRDKSGNAPIHRAAAFNRSGAADLLLEHGARLDEKNQDGFTPLEIALLIGSRDCVEVLVSRGARLDLTSPNLNSLMERVIVLDQGALLSDALKRGWSASTPLVNGWTARSIAEVVRSSRCIEILTTAGVDASADKHLPVVGAKELDAPLQPKTVGKPQDPRDPAEVFDEETVMVNAIVDADGKVRFAKIKAPSDQRLMSATIEALNGFVFVPPTHGGQPCVARVALPIIYPASNSRTFELSQVDQAPKALTTVPPVYPVKLRKSGVEGRTTLRFLVGTDGKPTRITATQSTGPEFTAAAIECLGGWTYSPGKYRGKPVPTWNSLVLIFSLKNQR